MTKENCYDGIRHIVHISTDIGMHCEHCGVSFDHEKIAESINHYIEQHGYRLLNVGPETIYDADGNRWYTTAAVLGVEKILPIWQSNIIEIRIGSPEIPEKN